MSVAQNTLRVVALVSLFTSGCSPLRKTLVGDYCLSFADETYEVTPCGASAKLRGSTDAGPLEGAVSNVGWDTRFIVAWRYPLRVGDRAGWMILDADAHTLEGPFSEEEFQARRVRSHRLQQIRIYEARQAWQVLR